ncbi:MAG TPA: methyltransferase domain-containing protein [Polyangiaceae bacterium]
MLTKGLGSPAHTQSYYDEFSKSYDKLRGSNDPGGYHELVDDLEVDFASRFAAGGDILEVGCGTGLLLERLGKVARSARGIDLSPGMLEKAQGRGLDVRQGSVLDLPYPDASFDVAYSFKVLAHVEAIEQALAEMMRVTRPTGVVLAEFYNPYSLRGLVKRFGPAGAISATKDERAVFTRFDSPSRVRQLLPVGWEVVASRGVRIVTPAAFAMRVPGLRSVLRAGEWALADSPLSMFGGFWIAAIARRA